MSASKKRDMTADGQERAPERAGRDRTVTILRLAGMTTARSLITSLLLFALAGTLDWWQGWLLLVVFLAVNLVVVPYLWRVNPDLLVARRRFHFVKGWDLALACLMVPCLVGVFAVGALDSGRFHWLAVPEWVCVAGLALFLLTVGFGTWVGAVNKFAEGPVRIQTERGHKVIDSGPYALVRHPGYVAAIPLVAGLALGLGSVWALLPAGLLALVLVVRTRLEDQTLQAELPGYKEYAHRVRYRLVPGLW